MSSKDKKIAVKKTAVKARKRVQTYEGWKRSMMKIRQEKQQQAKTRRK